MSRRTALPPTLSRRLRALASWLIIGSIATSASSWAAAALRSETWSPYRHDRGGDIGSFEETARFSLWSTYSQQSHWTTAIVSSWYAAREGGSLFGGWPEGDPLQVVPDWAPMANPLERPIESGHGLRTVVVVGAGWPMRAFVGYRTTDHSGHVDEHSIDQALWIPSEHAGYIGGQFGALSVIAPGWIPWRPRPLGFAVNSMVYGGLLGGIVTAVRWRRAALRVRYGHCPWCGHDLHHALDRPCPECGGIVTAQRRGTPASRARTGRETAATG